MGAAAFIGAGMADEIWRGVGGAGPTPIAARKAAADLIALYEHMNDARLEELIGRTGPAYQGPKNTYTPQSYVAFGEDLVRAATDRDQPSPFRQIQTPYFLVMKVRGDLVWEGGTEDAPGKAFGRKERLRNPHRWPGSEIQTLLFDKGKFSESDAKAWAKREGFHYGKVDSHGNYHRLRQFDPTSAPCRTIELANGVKAIVCSTGARGRPPGVPNGRG